MELPTRRGAPVLAHVTVIVAATPSILMLAWYFVGGCW